MVPITVATPNSNNALTFVLDKKTTTVVIENIAPEDWILVSIGISHLFMAYSPHCYHQVNPGRVGYFRVNYSSAVFEKLFVALKEGRLEERDRLAIQEDASALVS